MDIIIIDNASNDGTDNALDEYIKNNDIIYINMKTNLGGAGGFQYGIRFAVENNYDYIWMMDDDCMPCSDAIEELLYVDLKLNKRYGFLSSKVMWKDNTICKMNIQRETLTSKVTDFTKEVAPIVMASFVSPARAAGAAGH